jgi:hypothetical protein
MDCRILRHVTLKADGHLGCDDSIGYGINLGHVSLSPGWRLRDIFRGAIYRHVRSSFQAGHVPWPGTCESCDLLSDGAQPNDTLDTRIELLVEPTLACNITCACCLRRQIISKGRSTDSMDPAILDRFVNGCAVEGITIDQAHYIGWGEPLMHDDFQALYRIVKEQFPLATQMVTTAANVDFRSAVGDSALDRLVVSADGSRQEAYEKYRGGGDFKAVVKFMQDCRRYGSPQMFLEWKYILFDFNDSDEDILLAQSIADDLGVDSLLFIITNSKWHSGRFTIDNSHDVPIRSLCASVSPAAAMMATSMECMRFDTEPGDVEAFGFVDKCTISVGRFLVVEGWAFDKSGEYAQHVELVLDGATRSRARTHLRRVDVMDVYPMAEGAKCGFMFRIPVDPEDPPASVRVVVKGRSGAAVLGGRASWTMRAAGVKKRLDLPNVTPLRRYDRPASIQVVKAV